MKTQLSANSSASTKKTSLPYLKLVIATIVVLIVVAGILILVAPSIPPVLEGLDNENAGYTQLSLVAGVSQTYKQGGDTYSFSYKLSSTDSSGLFYVAKNAEATRSYPAVAGATYTSLGLEMKVSTVTSDLMVLLVKPQTT